MIKLNKKHILSFWFLRKPSSESNRKLQKVRKTLVTIAYQELISGIRGGLKHINRKNTTNHSSKRIIDLNIHFPKEDTQRAHRDMNSVQHH